MLMLELRELRISLFLTGAGGTIPIFPIRFLAARAAA